MLKQFSLSVAILFVTEASAQLSPIDLLAVDKEFRLEWGAYAGDKAQLSIELCQLGTCELLVSMNPNLESFLMFVDSYIVFASNYVDQRTVSRRDGPIEPIPYIGRRLADIDVSEVVTPKCGVTFTLETISCSLNDLAESLDIQKFSVRRDEGERNAVEQIDWRTRELSAAEIAQSLSWYADMGLPMPDLGVTPGAPEYWEQERNPPTSFCCSERFRQFMRERVGARRPAE